MEAINKSARSKARRVLVVDDSADMRWLMGEVLGQAGLDFYEACSGEEALTKVKTGLLPDVIVSDFHMGRHMNGADLLDRLRSLSELNRVPVILASDDPNIEELALRSGFDDFIDKCEFANALVNKVLALLPD